VKRIGLVTVALLGFLLYAQVRGMMFPPLAPPGASAPSFGTNRDGSGETGGVCYLARVAAHDANTLSLPVAQTQAAIDAVVVAARGSQNLANEKSPAILDLMNNIQTDHVPNLVPDIALLAQECAAAGE
jgi:hypothetical protein